MLKAIIFDCDGVIVDSEPHHLKAFQVVLEGEGISVSREAYYEKYLALDDKGFFETLLTAHNRPMNNKILKTLIIKKMAVYRELSQKKLYLYPGVVDFVKKAVGTYPLAIASGAFRAEIKFALDQGGIRAAFPVIVAAQDVKRGKPDPEAFLTALEKLNEIRPEAPAIKASESLVIEDSLNGMDAAHKAGMSCLAVTNSFPRDLIEGRADRVVDSLTEIVPDDLAALCAA